PASRYPLRPAPLAPHEVERLVLHGVGDHLVRDPARTLAPSPPPPRRPHHRTHQLPPPDLRRHLRRAAKPAPHPRIDPSHPRFRPIGGADSAPVSNGRAS